MGPDRRTGEFWQRLRATRACIIRILRVGRGAEPETFSAKTSGQLAGTKEDSKMWLLYLGMIGRDIKRERNAHRRDNIRACLAWVKKHGYPRFGYNIWALDCLVTCQLEHEYLDFWKSADLPYASEAYAVSFPKNLLSEDGQRYVRMVDEDYDKEQTAARKVNIAACAAFVREHDCPPPGWVVWALHGKASSCRTVDFVRLVNQRKPTDAAHMLIYALGRTTGETRDSLDQDEVEEEPFDVDSYLVVTTIL
ncbi:hypothetical protein NKR23_g8148 [Pleurostoma richardsiae]|uniref:Uncharacterized protein n=1 Tax=Pleurostoma richardsiae TaxID=41990 RepID=A0AA38VLT1_9PEZI|nr:hypothetical protein NKR23_g8148 [Pleurostoma richardsiae]